MKTLTSLELFTGAGGLALGLEAAGWRHTAVIEMNAHACATIRLNQTGEHPLMRGMDVA
jgi:DNA (cytosine-5)-methyltransferase 1